jgi:hypothetical protein
MTTTDLELDLQTSEILQIRTLESRPRRSFVRSEDE